MAEDEKTEQAAEEPVAEETQAEPVAAPKRSRKKAEPAAEAVTEEPAVEAAFAALSDIGTARLTGSGSGCFVEFASQSAAEQGRSKLPKELRARVAAGVARSPLLDALEQH